MVLPTAYSTAIQRPIPILNAIKIPILEVNNCKTENTVNNTISISNNLLRPILSAILPIKRLPPRPINVPAPKSPTQNVLSPSLSCAWVTAVPAIPNAYPQAICPRIAQR